MTIPTAQTDLFDSLAAADQLFGVPAIVLVAIDTAESGGQPGFVNSSGYGGLFGLAANTDYNGTRLTPAQLVGTDEPSLTAQAITCAAEFASLLDQTTGNVYEAETIYQGGASEGVDIMISLGVPETIPWPPAPPAPPLSEVYVLFSWDGKTYLITGGKGVLLTPNALKAVTDAGVKIVPDVEAGLYNLFVVDAKP